MDKRACLQSPAERLARQLQKEREILRFLREDLFSTSELLGLLLGLRSRQAIWKTLKQLEAREFIKQHTFHALGGPIIVWGVTPHGQALAFNPATETVARSYFEPSRVSEVTIRHALDLQMLRIRAEAAGWRGWRNGDRLGAVRNGNRPDAIVIDSDGKVTAIECERTFKTLKRYEVILSNYLQALKRSDFHRVIWVSPTSEQACRLRSMVTGIESVLVEGQRVKIDPQRHHAALSFEDYSSFAKRDI